MNQLTNKLVHEEERLKQQSKHVANVNYGHGNGNRKNKFVKKNGKGGRNGSSNQNSSSNQSDQPTPKKAKKNANCHFCKKV